MGNTERWEELWFASNPALLGGAALLLTHTHTHTHTEMMQRQGDLCLLHTQSKVCWMVHQI